MNSDRFDIRLLQNKSITHNVNRNDEQMMIQRNKLNGLNNNKKKSNKISFKQNAKNRNSIDREGI